MDNIFTFCSNVIVTLLYLCRAFLKIIIICIANAYSNNFQVNRQGPSAPLGQLLSFQANYPDWDIYVILLSQSGHFPEKNNMADMTKDISATVISDTSILLDWFNESA
jgi:uncharacterized phosphosugar-binding protein